jgi:hypothetical protein
MDLEECMHEICIYQEYRKSPSVYKQIGCHFLKRFFLFMGVSGNFHLDIINAPFEGVILRRSKSSQTGQLVMLLSL